MRSFTFVSPATSERERDIGLNFVELCLALPCDSVQKGKTLHSVEFLS